MLCTWPIWQLIVSVLLFCFQSSLSSIAGDWYFVIFSYSFRVTLASFNTTMSIKWIMFYDLLTRIMSSPIAYDCFCLHIMFCLSTICIHRFLICFSGVYFYDVYDCIVLYCSTNSRWIIFAPVLYLSVYSVPSSSSMHPPFICSIVPLNWWDFLYVSVPMVSFIMYFLQFRVAITLSYISRVKPSVSGKSYSVVSYLYESCLSMFGSCIMF